MYEAIFKCSRHGNSFAPVFVKTMNLSIAKRIASRHALRNYT